MIKVFSIPENKFIMMKNKNFKEMLKLKSYWKEFYKLDDENCFECKDYIKKFNKLAGDKLI